MNRILLIAFLVLFFLQACKKDNLPADTPPQDSVLDYMPLEVGNYWVYESYKCDSGEVNCESFSIDTNFVTKDTLINKNTYFKIIGKQMYFEEPRYYRDSGNFIVDLHGEIIFTDIATKQTYNHEEVVNNGDTLFYWFNWLADNPEDVIVDAGNFECLDFKGSLFRKADDFDQEHNMHNLYSKNVGQVKETTFYATSLHVVKRELVGYYIQP